MMIASYCSLFCALEIDVNKPRKWAMIGSFLGMLFQGLSYAIFKWYIIFAVGYGLVMISQLIIIIKHIATDFRYQRWKSQSLWLAVIGWMLILCSCT